VRRIGKVVREQVGLYGTLTGNAAGEEPPARSDAADPGSLADVVQLPRREGDRGGARDSR
jgi:hypothetical protein